MISPSPAAVIILGQFIKGERFPCRPDVQLEAQLDKEQKPQ